MVRAGLRTRQEAGSGKLPNPPLPGKPLTQLADATGLIGNAAPLFSADLKSYVYTYERITSDLYIVDGLR